MLRELDHTTNNRPYSLRDPGLWILARRDPSPRECEVWTLLAKGYGDPEIADRLGLNCLTVRFHVANLLVKLGTRDRREAADLAQQRGLVA